MTQSKVPTLFRKRNSRAFQGLIKDKIKIFKHYQIVICCIANALFSDKITSHTPIYNIHHEDHGSPNQSDKFDDEIIESL